MSVEMNVDVKKMVPERFFEFAKFDRYEKCNTLFLEPERRMWTWLTSDRSEGVVGDQEGGYR